MRAIPNHDLQAGRSNPLRVYCPEHSSAKLTGTLREFVSGAGIIERDLIESLDLSEIQCLSISLRGTSVHVRSPFAFPFLFEDMRTEYKGELHLVTGVDWLVLGGSIRRLAELAAQHVAVNGVAQILVVPFKTLSGALGQQERAGDVHTVVTRQVLNYSQPYWERFESDLLALPEERWNELGSNTSDTFGMFEPFIRDLLVQTPKVIVDLGCGLGQTARSAALAFPGAKVFGFDASPQALSVARRSFQLPNLEFVNADISDDLGLPGKGVDLILSSNSVMYAKDQLGFARRLFACLRPYGASINYCRVGESHRLLDFPRSLLLPTTFQLEPVDWMLAASEAGFSTSVFPAPSAADLESHFFYAGRLANFKQSIEHLKFAYAKNPPRHFAPHHSHALLVHSRRIADQARHVFFPGSHPAAVARSVMSLAGADEQVQKTVVMAWLFCFASLHLFPEAVGFISACLPGAEKLVDMVFTPALRRRRDETRSQNRRFVRAVRPTCGDSGTGVATRTFAA